MQVTAEMLREVFQQTQREILEIETPERYQARWERMAELLNEKLAGKQEQQGDPNCEKGTQHV